MTARAGSIELPLWLILPAVGFLLFAYVLPGFFVVLMGVGHPASLPFRPELLDISGFVRFIESSYYVKVLLRTLLLGLVVGVVTALLGYPVAYYLVRSRSRMRRPLYLLTLVPMAVGMNMLTLGWLILLGRNGLLNGLLQGLGIADQPIDMLYSWMGLTIGLTNVLFSFMVLPIAAVLRDIEPALEKAARNLGAGPVRTFLLVTLPLSLEGIAAGFLAVFMQTVGALVMPMLLSGPSNTILPVLIWEQFTVANDRVFAATLSIVLLTFAFVVLLLQMQLTRRRRQGARP